MKPFLIVIAAVAILCVAALALVSVGVRTPAVSGVATSTLVIETDVYRIDMAYPKFHNAAIDAQVQALVDKAVNDFKEVPPNPTPEAAKNEMFSEYRDVYVGPDLYSARLDIYEYTGGAHGGTIGYGLNYHADGRPYTLDEALGLISQSLEQVAERANTELVEQFEVVQFPDGATPTPENYSTFVIGKDSVTFIFQQYQVEAYAAGMPEVVFAREK